jgi:nucleoside-diphosphate-sugar epimerase
MSRVWPKQLSVDTIVRMMADALMVSSALLIALTARYIWRINIQGVVTPQTNLHSYVQSYLSSVWLLMLVSLGIFYVSGFYTHSRRYRGRYKALVVAQAVSLSYLLFGFLAYLFPQVIILPRSVLIPAWMLTLVFLVGVRLWSMLWRAMMRVEQRLYRPRPSDNVIRNVLIIGGAGYIGSALLPKLLDQGYRVRLLDLLLFGTEPIRDLIGHPHLEIIQADFRQVDTVVQAMRDMDAVVHLGAIVGDPACALDEELTVEVNLMATRMIAEVAKGSGVNRFIFASTCSVYGASDQVLDEHSALNPVSLYARSKTASEKVLLKMSDESFAPIVLRFGTVYGLSGRTRFDLVVNLLTAQAVLEGQMTLYGGDQWRPFVHVDDAALAIFKVLTGPETLVRHQIFNVGSDDQNYTIQQVGAIVQRLVPTAEVVSMGTDTDRRNYRVNFSKIRNTLNFVPQRVIEQGIQQVIDAIRAGKVSDYRDVKYSNVKFLAALGTSGLIHHQNGWAYELLNDTLLPQASTEANVPTAEPLQVRAVGG